MSPEHFLAAAVAVGIASSAAASLEVKDLARNEKSLHVGMSIPTLVIVVLLHCAV